MKDKLLESIEIFSYRSYYYYQSLLMISGTKTTHDPKSQVHL